MPDYIFIDENGQLLTEGEMSPHKAAEEAQVLARQYRTNVAYAEVVRYGVEPDTCEECGQILAVDDSCPDCDARALRRRQEDYNQTMRRALYPF